MSKLFLSSFLFAVFSVVLFKLGSLTELFDTAVSAPEGKHFDYVASLIVPGLSAPSLKYRMKTDLAKLYDFVGGMDTITSEGKSTMYEVGYSLGVTFHSMFHFNVSLVTRLLNLEKCASGNKHLFAGLKAGLLKSGVEHSHYTTDQVLISNPNEDFLLNAHSLCQNVDVAMKNARWGTKQYRETHFIFKLLLERFTDIGEYTRALHVADLPKISDIAQYRFKMRKEWIAQHLEEFHWERMKEYMVNSLHDAAEIVRRIQFDLQSSRWVGGNILKYLRHRMDSQGGKSLKFDILIGEEEPVLAILTLLEAFSTENVYPGKVWMNSTQPGSHFEIGKIGSNLVFYFDGKALNLPICRLSSLRRKVTSHCCSVTEFDNFLEQSLKSALNKDLVLLEHQKAIQLVKEFENAYVGDDQVDSLLGNVPEQNPLTPEQLLLLFPEDKGNMPGTPAPEEPSVYKSSIRLDRPDNTPTGIRYIKSGPRSESPYCPFNEQGEFFVYSN